MPEIHSHRAFFLIVLACAWGLGLALTGFASASWAEGAGHSSEVAATSGDFYSEEIQPLFDN
ncbi:MAG: hypothetical protein VX252_11350, partial [Myxococcota bacterium]|nr:hypothetical protein [Myxococcota bacterium]